MEQIYRAIVEDIKLKIQTGGYRDGTQLPSEEELKNIYHTSKSTVRKALRILSEDGYTYSVSRKGNFIKTPNTKNYILYFDEEDRNFGIDQTEVLARKTVVEDRFILEIPDDCQVVEIKSIFRSSEIPVGFDEKHILCKKELLEMAEPFKSLNFPDILSWKPNINRLEKTLTISGFKANQEIASALKIKECDDVIKVEHRCCDENEELLAYGVTYYRPSHIKLTANSK